MIARPKQVALILMLVTAARAAQGQAEDKSRTDAWWIGAGVESNTVLTNPPAGNEHHNGIGGGAIVGFGFDDNWSIYAQGSTATMKNSGSDFGLTQLDLGMRVHFRSGKVAVPFIN